MGPSFLMLLLLLLASCAGTSKAPGGLPADCEIRVGETCYQTAAEACAAVDCPIDRCLILDSYPGQVQCQAPAADPDTGTGTVTGQTQECHPANCGADSAAPKGVCPDGKTRFGPTGRCMFDPVANDCGWEIIRCP